MKALLIIAFLVFPLTGVQAACYSYSSFLEVVKDKYGEVPYIVGAGDNGSVLIIFYNDKTTTFTVTLTKADGSICPKMSGEGLAHIKQKTKGSDS